MCSLYSGVSLLHICIPLAMVFFCFNNNSRKQFKRSYFRQLGIHNWHCKPCFWHLLAHWMTRQLDDWSCDFGFFSKQLDAPSIGMLVYYFQIHFSSYWISSLFHQFIFFTSALTLSPLLGAKLCCIWGCFCDWV